MRLIILIGASGSGKTTIARAIRLKFPGLVEVRHFDSIDEPSPEAMITGWGSVEAWERAVTLEWVARIAIINRDIMPILFEGQMRLAFLREGLLAAGISDAHVILVDCDDATRTSRLMKNRNQPELANQAMVSWAAFLRREASDAGCDIMDTSKISIEASVDRIRNILFAPSP